MPAAEGGADASAAEPPSADVGNAVFRASEIGIAGTRPSITNPQTRQAGRDVSPSNLPGGFNVDWWETAGCVHWDPKSIPIFDEFERCQNQAEGCQQAVPCSVGDGNVFVHERGIGNGRAFEPSNTRVISIATDAIKNFRTRFTKIVQRAGLKPWPKLFQNLRVTRQTELSDQFPSHVVCESMGNSQPVAIKHHFHTTKEHFAKAANSAAPALQKGAESTRIESQSLAPDKRKTPVFMGNPTNQGSVIIRRMDDRGLEPLTSTMSTWRSNQLS